MISVPSTVDTALMMSMFHFIFCSFRSLAYCTSKAKPSHTASTILDSIDVGFQRFGLLFGLCVLLHHLSRSGELFRESLLRPLLLLLRLLGRLFDGDVFQLLLEDLQRHGCVRFTCRPKSGLLVDSRIWEEEALFLHRLQHGLCQLTVKRPRIRRITLWETW